jgi:CIC family chloride channel protein
MRAPAKLVFHGAQLSLEWLRLDRLPKQPRVILQTCLYGLAAGVSAVAFQVTMNALYRVGIVELSRHSFLMFSLGSLAIILGSSLLVGWLLNSFCPEAAGSGIPQLKVAFWKDFGFVPWRVAWVKFLAGAISIGGGSSLGREGPSVQLAGAVSTQIAGLVGEPKQNRRLAAASGAAAGLAAAFNTPLAAVTFVLEEIIGDLNSRLLGGVLLASVLGALVVHGLVGKQPAFALRAIDSPTWRAYALTPAVAAAAALVGVYFQRAALGSRARLRLNRRWPAWLLPSAGALLTWALGVAVFHYTSHLGVFGLGYDDLSTALRGGIAWKLAAVLLAAKFIATFGCYGFGGCGGIFSPTLFFGGMTGVFLAGLVGTEMPLPVADVLTLAVVGMSACLGAVVWAPVTGILIVFEMTHEFALVPTLMLGALVSQAISRRMNRHNFYDALIEQDGHRIEHVKPPRDLQSWQQLPVSAIANFRPVVVRSLVADELVRLLREYPYNRFPVVNNGTRQGILLREEAQTALRERRAPRLKGPVTCLPDQSIRDLQLRLIESNSGLVVLVDPLGATVLGLVTLHDLLRAEMSASKERG